MVEPGDIPFRDLDDLHGATLGGRFRLDQMIGRGGYGAVFLGEQISIGRRCAIKVLVPHVLEKKRNVRRFEFEARATSVLVHPNTVVIYDFGLDEDRRLLFIAMEYIDGESLRERIAKRQTIDVETTARIVRQAAGSLQDAHDRGLVHRDVKPHNIMLTERGGNPDFVKVIDFGIAKFLDDEAIRETFRRVTQTGVVIGTPAYMSPEQVRSEDLDGRADQYALAACVHQMLTGARLFEGKSPVDIATKQLTHRPKPVSELNPDVPGSVDGVLLRALAKNRDDRFPTIAEFSAALADAAGVALPTDSTERARTAAATDDDPTTEPLSLTRTQRIDHPDEHGTQPALLRSPAVPDRDAPPAPARDAPRLMRALTSVSLVKAGGGPNVVGVVVAASLVALFVVLAMLAARRIGGSPGAETTVADAPDDRVTAAQPEPESLDIVVERATRATAEQRRAHARAGAAERRVADSVDLGIPDSTADPAEEAPAAEKGDESSPPPRIAEYGRVTVTVVPWGMVVIDGEARGRERQRTYRLRAGTHTFELRQNGERVARKTVDVLPGKNRMVKLIAAP